MFIISFINLFYNPIGFSPMNDDDSCYQQKVKCRKRLPTRVIEKIIFRFLKFWLLCNRSVKAFDIRKPYLTALMQSFLFKPLLWINGFKINLSFRFYFDCMFIANELTVSIKRVILIRKRKLCFLRKDWKLEGY